MALRAISDERRHLRDAGGGLRATPVSSVCSPTSTAMRMITVAGPYE